MDKANDFFQRMTKEAIEDLAGGERGWREVDTNTLLLACFGMLSNHLASKVVRPLWAFAITVGAGVVSYIVVRIVGV